MKNHTTKLSVPFSLALLGNQRKGAPTISPFLTFLIVSIALFGISETTLAQGKSADTFKDSVDGNITFNPCTGEGVMLAGNILFVVREQTDATGARHAHLSIRGQGVKGVGMDSGNRYEAGGVSPITTTVELGQGATAGTSVTSFHLISHGSEQNFVLHLVFHFTINANGDFTSEVASMLPECRG